MSEDPPPAEAVEDAAPSKRGLFRRKPKPPKVRRHLLIRLFGIGLLGTIKLALLCVLVGFFVMAANFNPVEQDVNIIAAMASALKQAGAAAGWAARNFWQPALAGAGIVLPIWVLWRLLSLPFRR